MDAPEIMAAGGASAAGAGPPGETARTVLSIRWVVSIASVLLTGLVGASIGIVAERNARRALAEELTTRLCVQAEHLALVSASAMLTPFPELTLHPFLLNLRERDPELALGTVCDRNGTILGDADPSRLGQPFEAPQGLVPRTTGGSVGGATVSESMTLLLASAPVVHPNGTRLGTAYLALRRSHVEQAVRQARRPVLALFVTLMVLGVVGSFMLTSTLLKPMAVLRDGLERIGGGDLDVRLDLGSRTEFGRLAMTVNRMTSDLKRGQEQTIERERLAHEMQLAQHIQRSLLPPEWLSEGAFVVGGRQRPAAEVGGDFYDTFRLPDGRIGFGIADVAGKGL